MKSEFLRMRKFQVSEEHRRIEISNGPAFCRSFAAGQQEFDGFHLIQNEMHFQEKFCKILREGLGKTAVGPFDRDAPCPALTGCTGSLPALDLV